MDYYEAYQHRGFPGDTQSVKNLSADARNTDLILGSGRTLEKEMATHSSILVGCSPWGCKK